MQKTHADRQPTRRSTPRRTATVAMAVALLLGAGAGHRCGRRAQAPHRGVRRAGTDSDQSSDSGFGTVPGLSPSESPASPIAPLPSLPGPATAPGLPRPGVIVTPPLAVANSREVAPAAGSACLAR